MKNFKLFTSLLLVFSIANAREYSNRIIVLDPVSNEVSEERALNFSTQLRDVISSLKQFNIVEVSEIHELIEIKNLEKLRKCKTLECIAFFSKDLDVGFLVNGSIEVLSPQLWKIELNLFDISTSRHLNSISRNIEVDISQEEMDKLVRELFDLSIKKKRGIVRWLRNGIVIGCVGLVVVLLNSDDKKLEEEPIEGVAEILGTFY